MKIATYNINDVNKRLANLLEWLAEAKPDVVCLQELKAAQGGFPVESLRAAGYAAVWKGQRSWNGVAILARGARAPIVTATELPGDLSDVQARYIEAAVSGVIVASIYLPNGNPRPGSKFDFKLAWFERLIARAAVLREAGVPAVLAGDFNVAPTDLDIYPTTSWAEDALIHPKSRAAFRRLTECGWLDAIRALHPDARTYTFWSYKRGRWRRDAGLRLDHILLSPSLASGLRAAGVDRAVRERQDASDHAPVWIELDLGDGDDK